MCHLLYVTLHWFNSGPLNKSWYCHAIGGCCFFWLRHLCMERLVCHCNGFGPHPEVPCLATKFVGPDPHSHQPAARTSGPACKHELQSNNSNQDFWKTASPQHAQCGSSPPVLEGFRNFPRTCPEFLRNFPGISPEFRELPWNFRNSGLPKFQSQTNFRIFLRNLPTISGTCPGFPRLSQNFSRTFPELSRNVLGATFPGTPQDLVGFLPKTWSEQSRLRLFSLMRGRHAKEVLPKRKSSRSTQDRIDQVSFKATKLDHRQITHLICARLYMIYMIFLGGVLGLLPFFFLYKRPKNTPWKSHIDHILGGHRLDE